MWCISLKNMLSFFFTVCDFLYSVPVNISHFFCKLFFLSFSPVTNIFFLFYLFFPLFVLFFLQCTFPIFPFSRLLEIITSAAALPSDVGIFSFTLSVCLPVSLCLSLSLSIYLSRLPFSPLFLLYNSQFPGFPAFRSD